MFQTIVVLNEHVSFYYHIDTMGDIKLQDMNTNTLLGLFHLVFDFLFHILLSFLHDQDLAVCKIFFQVFLVKF